MSIRIEGNIEVTAFGQSPVGSVTAYLKHLMGAPSLPNGWVECNGQVLVDAESPFNGVTIPNLNGASAGVRRFLRGSPSSGAAGGTETHNHTGWTDVDNIQTGVETLEPTFAVSDQGHAHEVYPDSTLPSFYEVVWVIRVK